MAADRKARRDPKEVGAAARALVRGLDRATLASAMADSGAPYASLVMTACDQAGRPILMISELAEHTRNVLADARASLLFDGTEGLDNPLTGARVTVMGRVEKTSDDALRQRYLARHPDAEIYAGFADFGLYRMAVERVHLVAGFGEIHWIGDDEFLSGEPDGDLALAETDIVAHMNDDHADALALYAVALDGRAGGAWRMTGIDCDGIDLRLDGITARIAFERPIGTSEEARIALAELARKARKTAENQG